MSKNTKEFLFEMMGKINTDFPNPNKDNSDISGDVRNVNRLRTPAQRTALSKVNTQQEFNEAFETWFNTLGISTEEYKNKINITTSITNIRKVMEKNGIKY